MGRLDRFIKRHGPGAERPLATKKGTPFKCRRYVRTDVRNGVAYIVFLRVGKGFHTERQPFPGARAGVVYGYRRAA